MSPMRKANGMNIYKVSLRPQKSVWVDWPKMEMFFTHRPTNDQIIKRLEEKIDPEMIFDDGDKPFIQWFLDKVTRWPIENGESYHAWMDFPPAGKTYDSMDTNGHITIHDIQVTENE